MTAADQTRLIETGILSKQWVKPNTAELPHLLYIREIPVSYMLGYSLNNPNPFFTFKFLMLYRHKSFEVTVEMTSFEYLLGQPKKHFLAKIQIVIWV